jgi:predicted Zn-dependent peptidase
MKESNLDAARQSVLNDIQNSYPTFRSMPAFIANQRLDGYTSNPDAEIARLLPTISADDIVQFSKQFISTNPNRVWIIIGDKKLTDMKALARFGRVIELKKEEIYR